MTDINRLAAWIGEQYDEDVRLARAAASVDPSPWTAFSDANESTNIRRGHGNGVVEAADGEPLWDCEGSSTLCMTEPTAAHVAAHDPARVIGAVEAKRDLVTQLVSLWDADIPGVSATAWDCLGLLAAEYDDRAGYAEAVGAQSQH